MHPLEEKYEPMLSTLEKQADQYREMTELARKQLELLDASDADALTEVLSTKRELLAAIERGNEALAPLKAAWAEERENVPDAFRSRVEAAVDEVRSVLKKLVELENSFKEQISGRKEAASNEIRQVMKNQRARRAYGQGKKPASGDDPRFMDQKE